MRQLLRYFKTKQRKVLLSRDTAQNATHGAQLSGLFEHIHQIRYITAHICTSEGSCPLVCCLILGLLLAIFFFILFSASLICLASGPYVKLTYTFLQTPLLFSILWKAVCFPASSLVRFILCESQDFCKNSLCFSLSGVNQ